MTDFVCENPSEATRFQHPQEGIGGLSAAVATIPVGTASPPGN
jgi:hypothetical protein